MEQVNEQGRDFFCGERDSMLEDAPNKKLFIAILLQAYEDLERLSRYKCTPMQKQEILEFWSSELWEGLLEYCDLKDYIPKIKARIQAVIGGGGKC